MGHKVSPKLFRLGVIYQWHAKWFSKRNMGDTLKSDVLIRAFLKDKLKDALINHIDIERTGANVNIIIHAAKPGLIICRSGGGHLKFYKIN